MFKLSLCFLPEQVQFDEVFGEPEGVRSLDGVWRCSYVCFSGTLSICYKILTVLCGVPYAFCWACTFACIAFEQIWYTTPYLRCCSIELLAMRKMYAACLEAFLAPCCETMGYCFSKITVKNN